MNKYLEKIASNRYVREILKNFPNLSKGDAKYYSIHSVSPSTLLGSSNGYRDTGLHNLAVKDKLEKKRAIGHIGKTIDVSNADILEYLKFSKKPVLPR